MTPHYTQSDIASLPTTSDGSRSTPSPTMEAEKSWLKDLINQQFQALMLADLGLGHALNADMQILCSNIVSARFEEIHLLQNLLAKWHGDYHEPELGQQGEQELAQLAGLEDQEFEVAFMRALIRRQSANVCRVGECTRQPDCRAALKRLCNDFIETQLTEKMMLEEWLFVWHGVGAA